MSNHIQTNIYNYHNFCRTPPQQASFIPADKTAIPPIYQLAADEVIVSPSFFNRFIVHIVTFANLLSYVPQILWKKLSNISDMLKTHIYTDETNLSSDGRKKIQHVISEKSSAPNEDSPAENFLLPSVSPAFSTDYPNILERLSTHFPQKGIDRDSLLTILRSQSLDTIDADAIIYTRLLLNPKTSFDQIISDIAVITSEHNFKIAIPLEVARGTRKTIVALIIDRQNYTIDFLCPKGYSWRNDVMNTIASQRFTIRHLMERLIVETWNAQAPYNAEISHPDIIVRQLNGSMQNNDPYGIFMAHALCQFLRGKNVHDEDFHHINFKKAQDIRTSWIQDIRRAQSEEMEETL